MTTGRRSYKIFADDEQCQAYLKKHKDKTCRERTPVFKMLAYKEFANSQVRRLTTEEVQQYLAERSSRKGE